MKEYARAFYTCAAWKKTKAAYMISKHYICERCGNGARIVHHRKYITPQNIHDVEITLSWDNLEALCMDCHNAEHTSSPGIEAGLRFDESGNVVKSR
jgi:5-methylcytosine-specific restriction endonuclease McrA